MTVERSGAMPDEQSGRHHEDGQQPGRGPREHDVGASFRRDPGELLRRALHSRRARNAWTGAVALAVTGSVLVSASASVSPPGATAPGTTTSASAADADRSPARAAAGTAARAALASSEGITTGQVLAVLERAERMLQRRDGSLSPAVAQAAAELGMLWTTYQAQQEAHAEEQDPGYVTFDEVAAAAVRLANMLDPSSPTALVEALPNAESSLRRSLLETVAAYDRSTVGYSNGRIPADVLCPLEFAPAHMLRCDAAERLTALSAEFEKEFGYPIPLTDSYRSYAMQVAVQGTKPHLAAIPGTSNHGWGLAIDLDDPIAGGSSPEYVWLRLHAPDYGWDNPSWARLDGAKPEPWHFEFFAAGSIPNRAIDPSDVGTWAPAARADRAGSERPEARPAAGRTPAEASPAGDDADSTAGGSSPAGSRPAQPEPAEPEPAKPAPAEPAPEAPAEPEPADPPAEDPASGGDPVTAAVDDTVQAVDDTLNGTVDVVDGVVNGVVGGLLGAGGTSGTGKD